MLGPQISISIIAVCCDWSVEHAQPSMDVKVLLPTPPFPLMIRIFRLTLFIRAAMRGRSGSGPLGVLAQVAWFGQPSQAEAFPAFSDSVPGQCAGAFYEGNEHKMCASS